MGFGFPDKYAGKDSLVSRPDGAEPEVNYQMVPVGGQRDLLVQTGAQACVLNVNDPTLFEIRGRRSRARRARCGCRPTVSCVSR